MIIETKTKTKTYSVAYRTDRKLCSYCHQTGHLAQFCKANPDASACNNCGKWGHFTSECRRAPQCKVCKRNGHIEENCRYKNKPQCSGCGWFGFTFDHCQKCNKDAKPCDHCGKRGHFSQDCRFKNSKDCGCCGQKGHKADRCMSPPKLPDLQEQPEPSAAGNAQPKLESSSVKILSRKNAWDKPIVFDDKQEAEEFSDEEDDGIEVVIDASLYSDIGSWADECCGTDDITSSGELSFTSSEEDYTQDKDAPETKSQAGIEDPAIISKGSLISSTNNAGSIILSELKVDTPQVDEKSKGPEKTPEPLEILVSVEDFPKIVASLEVLEGRYKVRIISN